MSDFSITTEKHPTIVFVHGYEVYENGRLSPLSHAVCEATKRLREMNSDVRVILLGGWHLKEAGTYTIADAMMTYLITTGMSPKRIITKWCFKSLDEEMPPRDTWEELIHLKGILTRLNISPKAPLQAVAWDFHVPRLKKMYATYGLTDVEIIPVTPPTYKGLCHRRWIERMARIARFIDPDGDGIICHGTRLGRTLNENLKPIIR